MNRVVIVDNDESEQSLVNIKDALRVCHIPPSVVAPQQAILYVETEMPSLVMIDVFATHEEESVMKKDGRFPNGGLASLSGFKLASTIKSLFPQVPIMLISGYKQNDVLAHAIGRGADGFLYKMDPADLMVGPITSLIKAHQSSYEPLQGLLQTILSTNQSAWKKQDALASAAAYFTAEGRYLRCARLWASMRCQFQRDALLKEVVDSIYVAVSGVDRFIESHPAVTAFTADAGLTYWLGYILLCEGVLRTTGAPYNDLHLAWSLACMVHNLGFAGELTRIACDGNELLTLMTGSGGAANCASTFADEGNALVKLIEEREEVDSVNIPPLAAAVKSAVSGDDLVHWHGTMAAILFLKMMNLHSLSFAKSTVIKAVATGLVTHDFMDPAKLKLLGTGWHFPVEAFPVGYLFSICGLVQPVEHHPAYLTQRTRLEVMERVSQASIKSVRITQAAAAPAGEEGSPPASLALEYAYAFAVPSGRAQEGTRVVAVAERPVDALREDLPGLRSTLGLQSRLWGSVRHRIGDVEKDVVLGWKTEVPNQGKVSQLEPTYYEVFSSIQGKLDTLLVRSESVLKLLQTHCDLTESQNQDLLSLLNGVAGSSVTQEDLLPILDAIEDLRPAIMNTNRDLAHTIAAIESSSSKASNVETKLKLAISLGFVCLETKYDLKGLAEAYDTASFRVYEKLSSLYANLKERILKART